MKIRLFLVAAFALVSSRSWALPERLDKVIQALFENNEFKDLVEKTIASESSALGSSFTGISVKGVAPSPAIQKICGSGSFSKSGTVLEVTLRKAKAKADKWYFYTEHSAERLNYCDPNTVSK